MTKRLYKSRNRVFCGVCGGVAEFLNIDPTIIRIAILVLVFAGFGSGLLIYLAAAIIMPEKSVDNGYADDYGNHMKDARAYDSDGSNNRSSDDEFNRHFNNRK